MLAPLVAALRDAGHRLGGVFSERNYDAYEPGVFERRHLLERIPWPRHGSTPQTFRRALAEMRESRYDVALIASEEPEAYLIARRARIARRIGFWNGFAKPFKSLWVRAMCSAVVYRPAALVSGDRQHEVQYVFALGRGLCAESEPTARAARLRPLLVGAGSEASREVAVQLTERWRALGITPEALGDWLRALAQRRPVRALASKEEEGFARSVATRSERQLECFSDVAMWKRRIAAAAALVTPDTGAAHVAGMVGTPVVDVFPDGPHVARQIERWRPWAAPYRALAAAPATPHATFAALDDALRELAGAG